MSEKTAEISFVVYPGETAEEALAETVEGFPGLASRVLEGLDGNGHPRAEVSGPADLVDKFLVWFHETLGGTE